MTAQRDEPPPQSSPERAETSYWYTDSFFTFILMGMWALFGLFLRANVLSRFRDVPLCLQRGRYEIIFCWFDRWPGIVKLKSPMLFFRVPGSFEVNTNNTMGVLLNILFFLLRWNSICIRGSNGCFKYRSPSGLRTLLVETMKNEIEIDLFNSVCY